jgi:hypothetical protein
LGSGGWLKGRKTEDGGLASLVGRTRRRSLHEYEEE